MYYDIRVKSYSEVSIKGTADKHKITNQITILLKVN